MSKRKPTKVEISHGLSNLFGPSKIVIDGKRLDGVCVTVEGGTGSEPTVMIDGGRVLYPTEVWLNGVLMAKVDGLLAQGRASKRDSDWPRDGRKR